MSFLKKTTFTIYRAATFSVAIVVGGLLVSPASAEGCFVEPAKLGADDVTAFTENPNAILEASPTGGYLLSSKVRSLAGSETTTVEAIIALAEAANDRQIQALGAGLAQAATACILTRPEITVEIQQAVAASGNEALIAAFAAAAGDTETAALGDAGAPGGGTPGPGPVGDAGDVAGGEDGPSSFVANEPFSISSSFSRVNINTTVEGGGGTSSSVSPVE